MSSPQRWRSRAMKVLVSASVPPKRLDTQFCELGFDGWLREDFVDRLIETIEKLIGSLWRRRDRKPCPGFKTEHADFGDGRYIRQSGNPLQTSNRQDSQFLRSV